jgi:hypothetical protein
MGLCQAPSLVGAAAAPTPTYGAIAFDINDLEKEK